MEASVPKGPTPLAILTNRDDVCAMKDIIEWVVQSSGRDEKDEKNYEEQRKMYDYWKSDECGDGALFQRDADMKLICSKFKIVG